MIDTLLEAAVDKVDVMLVDVLMEMSGNGCRHRR